MKVSRKTVKLARREKQTNPSLMQVLHRRAGESPKQRAIRETAEGLYREYASKGATWAACVQAVKTDWISQFKNKYRES